MSKKSKKIERKVRKALKKELTAKLNTVIGEMASNLEVHSKKTKKTIVKVSKQLSVKLSDKVNIATLLKQEKRTEILVATEIASAVIQEEQKVPVQAKPVTRRAAPVRKPAVSAAAKVEQTTAVITPESQETSETV